MSDREFVYGVREDYSRTVIVRVKVKKITGKTVKMVAGHSAFGYRVMISLADANFTKETAIAAYKAWITRKLEKLVEEHTKLTTRYRAADKLKVVDES